MTKREEHNAGNETGEGRPLCPFCGSSEVSYLERYKRWQCGNCERILSHVSRGGGSHRYGRSAPRERFKFTRGAGTFTQRGTQAKVTWQAVIVVIIVLALLAYLLSRC